MGMGKKIAVVVESLYIPEEIKIYQDRFRAKGYTVQLAANLWGKETARFYSDNVSDIPFDGEKPLEHIDVNVDVRQVEEHLSEYAAVLVAANYTSVRSRYFTAEEGSPRAAPAVRLIARAMKDPSIVKAALCHGLWLLTPAPELLTGRRVICHEVIRADVINAGGTLVADQKVVVDGDLVTGYSKHEAAELVDRVLDCIGRIGAGPTRSHDNPTACAEAATKHPETAEKVFGALKARFHELPPNVGDRKAVAAAARALLSNTLDVRAEVRRMIGVDLDTSAAAHHKPILLVASVFGTWAAELTLVAATLRRAGYNVTIATEDGSPPHLLGPSLDPTFTDGSWRCSVTSAEERDLALHFLDRRSPERSLFLTENIVNLNNRLARPPQVGDYLANPKLLEQYRDQLKSTVALADAYDGIVIAGGSGAIPGFMDDRGLQTLILAFHDLGKPVMGECNGGLAIAQTVDSKTGRSILANRAVTTHSWLDEYQNGWGWTAKFGVSTDGFWKDGVFDVAGYCNTEQWVSPGTGGNPLIDSEALFKNAAGDKGVFFSPPGSPYSVVVDGNLITCRTTPDGYPGTLALMAVLDGRPPLRGRLFIDKDERGRTRP